MISKSLSLLVPASTDTQPQRVSSCDYGRIDWSKKIDHGRYANIYAIVDDDGKPTRYIARVNRKKQEDADATFANQVFQRMIDKHTIFANAGVTIPILQIFRRSEGHSHNILILRRLRMDMANTLNRYMSYSKYDNEWVMRKLHDAIDIFRKVAEMDMRHGDAHMQNLMIDDEDRLWLIDFDYVQSGRNYMFDIASFLLSYHTFFPVHYRAHLVELMPKLGITCDLVQSLEVALSATVLKSAVQVQFPKSCTAFQQQLHQLTALYNHFKKDCSLQEQYQKQRDRFDSLAEFIRNHISKMLQQEMMETLDVPEKEAKAIALRMSRYAASSVPLAD